MKTNNSHIIQKQVIDITLPNTNAALDWQINKQHGFTAMINKELEKCFDEYDRAGNHLIIEKLDIDLGVFNVDNLQAEMPERVYAEIQKVLDYHFNISAGSIKKPEYNYDQTTEEDRFYNEQQGKLEALLFFLNKGHLPWWGSALAGWDEPWLQKLPDNEINNLKRFLVANDNAPIKRIATQFDDGFIHHLLQRMGITVGTQQAWNWLQNFFKNLPQHEFPALEKNKQTSGGVDIRQNFLNKSAIRAKYWFDWIAHALGKTEIPALNNLFDKHLKDLIFIHLYAEQKSPGKIDPVLLNEVPVIWQQEINAFIEQAKYKTTKSPEDAKDKITHQENTSRDLFLESITNVQNKPTDSKSFEAREKLLSGDDAEVSEKIPIKEHSSNDINKKNKIDEDTDALFVNDAGLVLLHPFLPQLFKNCGWLKKNIFFNDYAQTMAVYAMFYLATGKTEAIEHELVFHKFLAGIKWELPLEPVEPLNDLEKAACDELLMEVLKHWKPLSNTSPDGLRETYLQRNGKLEHIYSGWHLNIEHKTLDILLNRLPWGISLIKLPWMADKFSVTWQ